MAIWYWRVLEQSANLVEAFMLVVLLQKFLEPRYKSKWPIVASVFGVYAIIVINNTIGASLVFTALLYISSGALVGFLFFKGGVSSRILLSFLMMALIMVAEVLTIGVLQLAFNNSDTDFTTQTPYRMLGIIISKVLLIMLVYFAGRFSKKKYTKIPLVYNLCLLLVPFISIICMITINQYVLQSAQSILSPLWFVLSAVGLMFLNLLIIYLFEAFMDYSANQSQYQLMIQQADMLSKHLRETNTLQEETHRIWHDMKNHFTVIQWMVQSKSYEKLEQYMLTLNETIADSMLKIQSGNPVLDALLNPKAAEAKKYGIEMNINACVPANISIEDMDINILFSNALDNALEACKKLPESSDKIIDIDAFIKNDHLMLVMKNSFDGVIQKNGDVLKSTKIDPGRHGIGMGNMKRTVDKYDGHIVTNIEENMFILSAVMYCSVNCDKAV